MRITHSLCWAGRATAIAATFVLACLASSPNRAGAQTETAAAFYDGNVIRWIVPYAPGGGYDEYSRLLAPYFEQATGARVDIVNMPGSGGIKGLVEIFNAPADGTYLGIINGSAMVTNQLADIDGADYDIAAFNFLGRITADRHVMVAGRDSGIDDVADLRSDAPVVVGATGLGAADYVDALVVSEALGFEQRVVHGFDSSGTLRAAILRGDVDTMWGSLGSAIEGVEAGDHHVVLHGERAPDSDVLADVPSVWDLIPDAADPDRARAILNGWEGLSAVGRPVAGPPGIPDDRLAFLRDAFERAVTEPGYVADLENAQRPLSFASAAEITRIARQATQLSADVEDLLVQVIRGQI